MSLSIRNTLFILQAAWMWIIPPEVHAQDKTQPSAGKPLYDTLFIAGYTHQLTARGFILYQNASFIVQPDQINRIVFRPNLNFRVGLAGFWKWFGLGLSMESPFLKNTSDTHGETSYIDLRLNVFGRKLAGELFFQSYKGFYISDPLRSDGSHFIAPDMKTFSFGIAGYWIYNHDRYSIRAAFIQNERQRRSAGSLVVRPSFLYYQIDSEKGIIPSDLADSLIIPGSSQILSGEVVTLGLSPGYSYTQIFLKNFYISGTVFPGVFWQTNSYKTMSNDHIDSDFSFHLSGRFALGYNSDVWFIGGSVSAGLNDMPAELNKALFNYEVAQYRIWAGTRFDLFRGKKKK